MNNESILQFSEDYVSHKQYLNGIDLDEIYKYLVALGAVARTLEDLKSSFEELKFEIEQDIDKTRNILNLGETDIHLVLEGDE